MTTILRWIATALFLYAWFVWAGTFNQISEWIVDGGILIAVIILVTYCWLKIASNFRVRKFPILSAVGLFWLVASIVDVIRPHELTLNAHEFESLDQSILSDYRVSVSMSGGGYRAALFHAGVIDALRSLGVEPQNISAVSGGAIFGSFYRLGGDPVTFKEAVVEGKFNLKRELLLIHNFLRLPFPFKVPTTDIRLFPGWYEFNRLDVQQSLIERTIHPDRPSDNPLKNIVIGLSDLNFGMQIAAFDKTAVIFGPVDGYKKLGSFDQFKWENRPTIAELVAMSGAFPGAFPAKRKKVRVSFGASRGGGISRELAIVDGGVIDDFGRTALAYLANFATNSDNAPVMSLDWQSDAMVVSDGGALYKVLDDVTGLEALSRAFTVSDKYKFGRRNLPEMWQGVENAQRTILIGSSRVQLNPATRLVVDTTRRGRQKDRPYHIHARPLLTQPRILTEMAGLLLDKSRQRAVEAVKKYNENEVMELIKATELGDIEPDRYTRQKTTQDCLKALKSTGELTNKDFWQAVCRSSDVRWSIIDGGVELLDIFSETPTLKDTFDATTADNIFHLGKLLTFTNMAFYSKKYPHPEAQRRVRAVLDDKGDN